jgi:hypothetical protein
LPSSRAFWSFPLVFFCNYRGNQECFCLLTYIKYYLILENY